MAVKDKRIAYDYLFNYFGGEKFKDKVIVGAYVSLNIKAYKDGEEILFEEDIEPKAADKCFNKMFDVSFDRNELFVVKRNLFVDNLFRLIHEWDRIEAEVVGYGLDYFSCFANECEGLKDINDKLPAEFQNMPVSESMTVSEEEFRAFLSSHKDDFDIADNRCAQCPSVRFIDVDDKET